MRILTLPFIFLFAMACGTESHLPAGAPSSSPPFDGSTSLADGGPIHADAVPIPTADSAAIVPEDRPGGCFEIFPDGSGLVSLPHQNPTVFEPDAVLVGSTVDFQVRYFNFCADPNPYVFSAAWLDTSVEADGFAIVSVPATIEYGVGDSSVRLSFTPQRPGTFSATLRVSFQHGYYDIRISAEAVPDEG